MSETMTTITEFFTSIVGEIPPEFEGLFYVFALLVGLFIVYLFFDILRSMFGVTRWNR